MCFKFSSQSPGQPFCVGLVIKITRNAAEVRLKVDANGWANRGAWRESKRVRVVVDVRGLDALPSGKFVGPFAIG